MSLRFTAGDHVDIVVDNVPASASLRYILRPTNDTTTPVVDYTAAAGASTDELGRDATTVTVRLLPAATADLEGVYRQELKANDAGNVWLVTDGLVIVDTSLIRDAV